MTRVALTGNLGTGKTTALSAFKEAGALTLSADDVVAKLLKEPDIVEVISGLLGPSVVGADKRLDKKRVAEIIFNDDSLRAKLEDIIHPMVLTEIENMRQDSAGIVVVVEVPLLFERGYEDRFDKVVTVYTDEVTALGRLKAKGMSRIDAMKRIKAQLPIGEKVRRADYVIDNSGKVGRLEAQARSIFKKLRKHEDNKGA